MHWHRDPNHTFYNKWSKALQFVHTGQHGFWRTFPSSQTVLLDSSELSHESRQLRKALFHPLHLLLSSLAKVVVEKGMLQLLNKYFQNKWGRSGLKSKKEVAEEV